MYICIHSNIEIYPILFYIITYSGPGVSLKLLHFRSVLEVSFNIPFSCPEMKISLYCLLSPFSDFLQPFFPHFFCCIVSLVECVIAPHLFYLMIWQTLRVSILLEAPCHLLFVMWCQVHFRFDKDCMAFASTLILCHAQTHAHTTHTEINRQLQKVLKKYSLVKAT